MQERSQPMARCFYTQWHINNGNRADGNLILTQNGISTTITNCYPVFGSGTGGYAENALLTSLTINQIGGSSSYWTKIAAGV